MKKENLKEKRKKKSLKRKIFGGMFFCLLAAAGYFLVFSPVFWIKKIEVSGGEAAVVSQIKEIIEKELAGKKWFIVSQKSVFLAPAEKIERDILAKFPEIKIASIIKKIPDILTAEIEERKEIGIWCEQKKIIQKQEEKEGEITEEKETIIEKCFYLDSDGIIFRSAPSMSGSLTLKIIDSKKQGAQIGEQAIPVEMANFVQQIKNNLNKLLDLKILDFEIVSADNLRARTSQGWRIEFSPLYLAETQIEALKAVLENRIKENRAALEYVDLRIEGRVYYK